MTSTSYRFSDFEARKNRALGHIHIDGKYEPLYVRDPQPQSPAGGVSSSVNDLTHWLAMMLADGSYGGKQIVDAKALLPALTPQIVSSPPSEPAMRSGFYGFGFNVGTTSAARTQFEPLRCVRTRRRNQLRHHPVGRRGDRRADQRHAVGCAGGAHCAVRRPGAVRRGPRGLVHALRQGCSSRWRSRSARSSARSHRRTPRRPRRWRRYVGTYNNDYWGPARVTEKDGNLQLALGPKLSCPADELGRKRLHLRVGQPRTRRRDRSARRRSTGTS